MSGRLWKLSESVLESNFMKGLKLEIRGALRTLRPNRLTKAMELAQLIEDQMTTTKAGNGTCNPSQNNAGSTSTRTPKALTVGIPRENTTERSNGGKPSGNFKHPTELEMISKWAKRLCLQCDEKYSPRHRCKDRTLQVLAICNNEEEGDSEEPENPHLDIVKVSLNLVAGLLNHSMKIGGALGSVRW